MMESIACFSEDKLFYDHMKTPTARRLQMERENWSSTNPSLWSAQKIITKFSSQTFLWSRSCGPAFNTDSTADGSSKVTNPNPLQYGYKTEKSQFHYEAHCIFFRHTIYNTKLIARGVWAGRKKRFHISGRFSIYLDCFVFGSLITKHSFRSPYLLKYACSPSETDGKIGPLRNRELNHSRLFETWLISAHL